MLNKKDFILKLSNISFGEMIGRTEIRIMVWDIKDNAMYDRHFTDSFPELITRLGIDEEAEGDLCYNGNLNKKELKEMLEYMGFVTEI